MERLTERMLDGEAQPNCSNCWHYKECGDEHYCDDNESCYEKILERLAELEDKLESGQLVDTTPYITEIKSEIPFKYKVVKPTMHRRNVEMCDSKESAEACIKKLEAKYANKT